MSRPLKPCGTTAAFQRHLYHGEAPCDACRAAKRHLTRVNYQGRKAASTRTDVLFRELLDLIAAECRRAGMLPGASGETS